MLRRMARRFAAAWTVPPSREEIAAYGALALALGAHVLLALVRFHARLGMDERREWVLFLQLCPLTVATVGLGIVLLHALAEKHGASRRDLAWTLALLNVGGLTLIVTWLFAANFVHATWSAWSSALVGLLVLSGAVVAGWARIPPDRASISRHLGDLSALLLFGPVVFLCCAIPFHLHPPVQLLLGSAALGALFVGLHFLVPRASMPRWARLAFDVGILILVPAVVTDATLPFDMRHGYHYLGPVGAVVAGRHLLVDVWCQYGVWVVAFLAQIFRWGWVDLSLYGLSAIVTVLVILQCFLYYGLFLTLLRSRILAGIGLLLVFTVLLWGPVSGPIRHPSIGPLRFGLPFLLLGLLGARDRFPRLRAIASASAVSVLGISSLWSVETFLYCACAFGAFHAYDAGRGRATGSWAREFSARALAGVAAILVFQLYFHLETRLTTGSWPHWGDYFDFLVVYSALGGFSTMEANPYDPWWALLGLYLFSAVVCVLSLAASDDDPAKRPPSLVAGLTGLGPAMFTYWLGRSHPSNLIVASSPALLLLLYWVRRFTIEQPVGSRLFRGTLAFSAYGILAVAVMVCWPSAKEYFRSSFLIQFPQAGYSLVPLYQNSLRCAFHDCSLASSGALADWVRKYEPDKPSTALFVSPEVQTEVLLLLRRRHVLPVGHMLEDLYTESGQARIANAPLDLSAGDYLFFDVYVEGPNPGQDVYLEAQRETIRRACERFDCVAVETWRHYRAVRLESKRAGPGWP